MIGVDAASWGGINVWVIRRIMRDLIPFRDG